MGARERSSGWRVKGSSTLPFAAMSGVYGLAQCPDRSGLPSAVRGAGAESREALRLGGEVVREDDGHPSREVPSERVEEIEALVLREVAPGVTVDEVVAATGAPLTVGDDVPTMSLPATV